MTQNFALTGCGKKIRAHIPPRTRAGYWAAEYADRNQAVARRRLTGSNAYWKWDTANNRRSVAETAMYRVKQLFGEHLSLRDYTLNKMTRAGMQENVRIA